LKVNLSAEQSVRAQIVGFLSTINKKSLFFQGGNVEKMNS
jgi:hypothetical protein